MEPINNIKEVRLVLNTADKLKTLSSLITAEFKPIFKDGDKHNLNKYRPISLISNKAKIFEKIIYNRLYSFIK